MQNDYLERGGRVHVTILGAGAIGSLIAARIALSGVDVSVLVRDDGLAATGSQQLTTP